MKKSISVAQFIGFLFTSVAGVLLHFLYEWSGENFIISLFSAVNESIWEHMKLLYFPMMVFAVAEKIYFKDEYKNFWCVKLMGISIGLVLIPLIYYAYTGIFGVNADWFNIAIYFISAIVVYFIETKFFKSQKTFCLYPLACLIILISIGILFVFLTFSPPQIPLFQDPVTKLYGLNG